MTSAPSVRKQRDLARQDFLDAERRAAATPTARPPAQAARFVDAWTRWGRDGQCQVCGTWRTDGHPPTVHRHRCTEGPDGSTLPPVFNPAALRRNPR